MKYSISIVLAVFIFFGCQDPQPSSAAKTNNSTEIMSKRAPFIHTVFFYLNNEVSDEDKADFEIGLGELMKVKTISHSRIGKPAMTPRDVVDNDYGYALIVEFENKADHDAYQDDPIHLKFIETYEDLWADVKVYDSIMMD